MSGDTRRGPRATTQDPRGAWPERGVGDSGRALTPGTRADTCWGCGRAIPTTPCDDRCLGLSRSPVAPTHSPVTRERGRAGDRPGPASPPAGGASAWELPTARGLSRSPARAQPLRLTAGSEPLASYLPALPRAWLPLPGVVSHPDPTGLRGLEEKAEAGNGRSSCSACAPERRPATHAHVREGDDTPTQGARAGTPCAPPGAAAPPSGRAARCVPYGPGARGAPPPLHARRGRQGSHSGRVTRGPGCRRGNPPTPASRLPNNSPELVLRAGDTR